MSNVNKEFYEFGSRMYLIAILTLITLIVGIVGWFININTVIIVVNGILGFIIFIIFLLVLGDIKSAGKMLNNDELLSFRSKFIAGYIIKFIGNLIFAAVAVFLIAMLLGGYYYIGALLVAGIIVFVGIIILLIGAILLILAWSNLESFFSHNMDLFPQNIGYDSKNGAHKCKIAAILDITIILIFVGDILRMIGYFKLAALKNLVGAPAPQTYAQQAPAQPAYTQPPAPAATSNFCPSCGSAITPGIKFCPSCGSEI